MEEKAEEVGPTDSVIEDQPEGLEYTIDHQAGDPTSLYEAAAQSVDMCSDVNIMDVTPVENTPVAMKTTTVQQIQSKYNSGVTRDDGTDKTHDSRQNSGTCRQLGELRLSYVPGSQKSITTPGRKLEFLGIIWDLEQNLKSIPIKKQDRILHLLQSYCQKRVWCLKQAQILLGCLNFACFVIPLGRLHCRLIQIHCRDLRRSPKSKMTIPQEVLQELEWWELAVRKATPIHNPPITDFLVTDAASYGWGAILNNTTMAGVWDHHQTSWHSNRKELHAIYKALTQRKNHLKNRSLLIQSDNRTALSYLKNQGGTRSVALLQEARDILHLASVYNIHLVPQYLPGSLNGSADRLSRNRPLPEWHLLRCATQPVFRVFGHPQIDLFASKNAHVVNRYCTMDFLDQQAEFCNAFTQEWNYRLGWLFPPPYLVPKILIHLNKCQGQYILITPRWERTFWMPDLKSRVLQGPIQIEKLKETLVDTATMRPPPKIDSIILEAWLVQAGKIS
ncbi:unnamed protein product [Plutella xylostella]|uniref:(diamondback moth) hypothetical protein n=1 Tax=Plutella xylostella TaxID=51655 RepID=A0A8S4G0D7_PLUXY|nr:unnamed protein product [Plutella xylostella]